MPENLHGKVVKLYQRDKILVFFLKQAKVGADYSKVWKHQKPNYD